MNINKRNTIPQARKIITNGLIEFYEQRGIRTKDELLKHGLVVLELTKEEMNDHQSSGLYAKYRALTGTIIKELATDGLIEVKEKDIPQIVPVIAKPKIVKVQAAPKAFTIAQRRKYIIQTIADKYLTLEEHKNSPRINKLKSYVGDKKQMPYIEAGSTEDAIAYVEKWFLKDKQVNFEVSAKVATKKYPNTDIGGCLSRQYQIYMRFSNNDIKKKTYDKELENTLIEALHLKEGEFFEKLCLDIIIKVYGSRVIQNSDKINGGPNDHGIDAELKIRDELGSEETVFIQSKLSEKGEKSIREFVGALTIENGHKGIFMSAGIVSSTTRKFFESRHLGHKLIIIGRDELLNLMTLHNVGVKPDKNGKNIIVDDEYFLSE